MAVTAAALWWEVERVGAMVLWERCVAMLGAMKCGWELCVCVGVVVCSYVGDFEAVLGLTVLRKGCSHVGSCGVILGFV